jgi:hypothetical protein
MPPVPSAKTGFRGWVVLCGIAAALVYFLVTHPVGFFGTVSVLAILSLIIERKRVTELLPVAHDRTGEDIGTFARAFDRRSDAPIDPWAIRAVWNAIYPLTEVQGKRIPLRPTDRIVEDLGIDSEEIEYLVPALTLQCERKNGDWDRNPYYPQLGTVGGLVRFISAQPRQG